MKSNGTCQAHSKQIMFMLLNSERKGGFGPSVKEGPLTGPQTCGTLPTATTRAIKQLPGNTGREGWRERKRVMSYGTDENKNDGEDLQYVEWEDGKKEKTECEIHEDNKKSDGENRICAI